jgi:phage/plasmid-associated DNA primase
MEILSQKDAPTGWHFNGITSDGVWGMFAPERSPRQSELELNDTSLSASERDRLHRQMLSELTLLDRDKADLLDRGLTEEQIEAGLFRSVKQWQGLKAEFDERLPGVLKGGRNLNIPADGYLCPAFNSSGLIIGIQLRLNQPSDAGRYRWLTSRTKKSPEGVTPHIMGELPITVARPLKGKVKAIALAEGILKPWIAAQGLGCVFVGASGGNFSASSRLLASTLEKLSAEIGSQEIIFYPDAGAIDNDKVLRRDYQTLDLVRHMGYNVKIAWWGQETKDFPDCDELDGEAIKFLTLAEYEAIAPRPKAIYDEPVKEVESEEDEKHVKRDFPQITARKLYSDTRYISVTSKLYRWTGTHYEYCPDEVEEKRIAKLADETCVIKKTRAKDENGNPIYEKTYPYASRQKVNQALDWVKVLNAVSIDKCNPPGLNCKNGVLQISYSDRTPIFNFIPHSPDMYYLYEPLVEYNPDAYAEDCDRLLSALDKPQQQVFLRTIAAALDVEKVRERHGRIKALLAYGDGSNGKDSLRETVSLLWGRTGMTSLGTQDFAGYDGGRKFTLIPLPGSRINWSSENKKDVNLDSSEALKQAISGDELHLERKGVDPEPFTPKAVHIFNINHTPNIKAGMEAIKSRFAIVSFLKTFKIGANPELGEIEADPRFKYSKDFIQVNILPAFLNKIMDAFRALMEEGIDYSCCDAALEEAQSVNSHLFEFSKTYNLVADKNNVIPVKDLWDKLEEFYKAGDTPILKIDIHGNRVWDNDVRPGDPYVKGANQIFNRISKLFPRAKLVSIGNNRKGIEGIAFASSLTTEAIAPIAPPEPPPIPPETEQKELVPVASNGHTVFKYKPGDKVQCSKGSGVVVSVNCTTATIEGDTFYGSYPITELRLL